MLLSTRVEEARPHYTESSSSRASSRAIDAVPRAERVARFYRGRDVVGVLLRVRGDGDAAHFDGGARLPEFLLAFLPGRQVLEVHDLRDLAQRRPERLAHSLQDVAASLEQGPPLSFFILKRKIVFLLLFLVVLVSWCFLFFSPLLLLLLLLLLLFVLLSINPHSALLS